MYKFPKIFNPSVIFFLLLAVSLPYASVQSRFEAGTLHFGGGMGLRGSSQGAIFSVSASGGVFVLKGLDLGITTWLQTGGDLPLMFMLTADTRFIPFPDFYLTPYIHTAGGRLFTKGDDAWVLSAGGGLLYLTHDIYGIDFGVGYRWFFFPEEVLDSYYLQVGLIILF